MAINYIEVILVSEWMGNPKGSTLSLNSVTAQSLIDRGSAKMTKKKDEEGANITKDVASPPKDKMVRTSVRKKRI